MIRRIEPGHTEQTSATCSSVKIVSCVCFFLFHCCWFLSYFISFYGSNTCLFYVSNKLPFESKQLYVKVFFNLYLHYHHIIHSRMHRHARFIGVGLFFWSNPSFLLRVYVYTLTCQIWGSDLRRPKERSPSFNKSTFENSIQCHINDD